jgi:hypothetical protein
VWGATKVSKSMSGNCRNQQGFEKEIEKGSSEKICFIGLTLSQCMFLLWTNEKKISLLVEHFTELICSEKVIHPKKFEPAP